MATTLESITDAGKIAVPMSPRQIVAARIAIGVYMAQFPDDDAIPDMQSVEEACARSVRNAVEFASSLVDAATKHEGN